MKIFLNRILLFLLIFIQTYASTADPHGFDKVHDHWLDLKSLREERERNEYSFLCKIIYHYPNGISLGLVEISWKGSANNEVTDNLNADFTGAKYTLYKFSSEKIRLTRSGSLNPSALKDLLSIIDKYEVNALPIHKDSMGFPSDVFNLDGVRVSMAFSFLKYDCFIIRQSYEGVGHEVWKYLNDTGLAGKD